MTDSDAITAQLRELIARALPELDDDDPGLGPEALREQSLRAVELCLTMRSSLREVTQAAVDGARRNGASWAAIGQILGSSRQAAQQMYGSAGVDAAPSAVDAAPVVRTLYPVTAFDEMGKLAKLGADGWHAIRVGLQSTSSCRTPARGSTCGCSRGPEIHSPADRGLDGGSRRDVPMGVLHATGSVWTEGFGSPMTCGKIRARSRGRTYRRKTCYGRRVSFLGETSTAS